MKNVIAAMVLATALTACASTGNSALKMESASTLADKIVKGQTTQTQVREMLGSPTSTDFTDSGNQIWRYSYAEAQAMGRNFIPFVSMFSSGANVQSKQLVLFFDQGGVVQNYSMEESKSATKHGIIRQ